MKHVELEMLLRRAGLTASAGLSCQKRNAQY